MISFSSDWLYPSYQSQEIVRALRARNCDVAYVELQSNYGHDSFLVDVAEQSSLIRGFLANTFEAGDRVFLFGFSRGAYTVRCLAAIVHMYGLLHPGDHVVTTSMEHNSVMRPLRHLETHGMIGQSREPGVLA